MPALRKTHEQFVLEASVKNPDIEVLGQYNGSGKRVRVRCKKCGHEWSPTASNILQGFGCQKCARKKNANKLRKTRQEYVDELKRLTNKSGASWQL